MQSDGKVVEYLIMNDHKEILDLSHPPVPCAPRFPDFVVYPRVNDLEKSCSKLLGHISLVGDFDTTRGYNTPQAENLTKNTD